MDQDDAGERLGLIQEELTECEVLRASLLPNDPQLHDIAQRENELLAQIEILTLPEGPQHPILNRDDYNDRGGQPAPAPLQDDDGPAPKYRRHDLKMKVPEELQNAKRLHDVDDTDAGLFDVYANAPQMVDSEGVEVVDRLKQYHKMYFLNFKNLIRDLMWLRDGPVEPEDHEVHIVAQYLAWIGTVQVGLHHPDVTSRDEEAEWIDVATFHYIASEPLWTGVLQNFEDIHKSDEYWQGKCHGEDITLLLMGRDGHSPLPSPRSVLSELRAVRRHGRAEGAAEAVAGVAGIDELMWAPYEKEIGPEAAEEAAIQLRTIGLFEADNVNEFPTLDELAELVMITMSMERGEFAIEYDQAKNLALAIRKIARTRGVYNAKVEWLPDRLETFGELLYRWDELVSIEAVQRLNPMKRFGYVPNPVLYLEEVIKIGAIADDVGMWVFLDSTPVGARVPLHMLKPDSKWKLHDHSDKDGMGVIYRWPPDGEQRFNHVQRREAFLLSDLYRSLPEMNTTSPQVGAFEPDFSGGGAGEDSTGPVDISEGVMVRPREGLNLDDGWGVIADFVGVGSNIVETGSNGACFFNSVVYLLGYGSSVDRVTEELATQGPAWELRVAVCDEMERMIPDMIRDFGPVMQGDEGVPDISWEAYVDMMRLPFSWVHGDWEINATANVIQRVIECVQYEHGWQRRFVIGTPIEAHGQKIVLARHGNHYRAVERNQGGGRAVWMS
mmetsp:Transcript_30971/g.81072  ORF Transcript_30971/g.81072 Transcript_30971/m.81072 type:complete len:724 (+) Transcript_30971:202-2373(+)